jgi:DNA invertase Pin-like site-specific DNA recombinase
MMMKAILYARWSSQEQGRGSTLQRQTELGEAYCKAKGWPIVERLSDQGLSAYTGSNLKDGELGKLTARLEQDGGEGVVLVVEKLDRLSRQSPPRMFAWMQRVCATGATVASADGKHLIDEASLNANIAGMMQILMDSFVGYEESKKKSDRGLENWRIKRESGRPLTAQCPAWLMLSEDRGEYLPIPERASLVRRMFELADQNVGADTIAHRFNSEGQEPWGKGRRKGKFWHGSYVKKVLTNPAVLGDHQHGQKQRSDAKRKLGEVVKGYFPAVVDEALFARVNDKRRAKAVADQRHGTIANLFSGLARCSCGAPMHMVNKGQAKRADGRLVREDYLRCNRAARPNSVGGCDHRTSYPYAPFRDAVLNHLLHRALDDQFFRAPDSLSGLEAEVATKARAVADLERRRDAAFQMVLEDENDAHARTRYRTLKIELKAAQSALEAAEGALADARGATSPAEHLARVADVRAMMDAEDDATRNEARVRVKMALNDLVERCVFDGERQRALVSLVGEVGFLLVERNGSASWFDRAKPGRDNSHLSAQDQATLAGYLRRVAA